MPSLPLDQLRRLTRRTPLGFVERAARAVHDNALALKVLRQTGMLDARRFRTMSAKLRIHGIGIDAVVAVNDELDPDGIAIHDEDGSLTWSQLQGLANAGARALRERGVEDGATIGLLARNSRWFAIADVAASLCGARVVYLNTGFAGPQLAEVLDREGVRVVLHDDEFEELVAGAAGDRPRIITHSTGSSWVETLGDLVAELSHEPIDDPGTNGGQIILTSGTTGTPKGADRSSASGAGIVQLASIFSRIPHRSGQTMVVAAPMFHAWGLSNYAIAFGLGSTIVVRRRFDPAETLRLVSEHRADSLAVVPVMLDRMLALDESVTADLDLSCLSIVASSGSALPGSLATRWMDAFGDNLYNTYGSTEVALATIATPEDMRAAPGTAGKTPLGSVVRIYDDDDNEITEPGVVGRIFVGSGMRFEGYTDGNTKPSIDGLLSVGDLGSLDEDGRLFVGGRDDDMIVSGGENVFPQEVEDLLFDHPDIDDVGVVGVPDDEFGQRLRAVVVRRDGAELDEAAVKAHVKANLASYKVPRDVVFVDDLPRNATGKLLRRELAD